MAYYNGKKVMAVVDTGFNSLKYNSITLSQNEFTKPAGDDKTWLLINGNSQKKIEDIFSIIEKNKKNAIYINLTINFLDGSNFDITMNYLKKSVFSIKNQIYGMFLANIGNKMDISWLSFYSNQTSSNLEIANYLDYIDSFIITFCYL